MDRATPPRPLPSPAPGDAAIERVTAPVTAPPTAADRGGPWQPPADELLGTRLRDRFRVIRWRAEGGLSTVYLGADERRRDSVAIKVLHAAYAGVPIIRARFAREAELTMQLGARIGAAARGTGLIVGRPFLILDFLDGGTLRDQLAATGPCAPADAVRVVDRLLARLMVMHTEGFVHHDLKPAHVMAGGTALLDLGSALPIGAPFDSTGCSPSYGAPEQWREGALADPRADLYSVGVLLFELVSGRRPFAIDPSRPLASWEEREEPTVDSLPWQAHEHEHEQAHGVPKALVEIILRALAPRPEGRFASAAAMREALRSLLPSSNHEEES